MLNMRPYQREALDAVHERLAVDSSTLVVSPTGTGKTILFAHLIRERLHLGRAIVLAHRKELIRQNADKITKVAGVPCDIEMADEYAGDGTLRGGAPVVVATVQTLASDKRLSRFDPMEFATLICDEAHHYCAPQFRNPIDYFRKNQNLKVLGVTATPDRADEAALGQIYHSVAYEYVLWDAIMDGWLVPLKHWAKKLDGLDLSKVHTVAGELNARELASELAANQNLEAIAAATVECAGSRKTLLFADSVENAETITMILNGHSRGSARLLVGVTPDDERDKIITDYRTGAFQYLVNVGVCTEGYDEPGVSCIALARPTKSRALAAQMIGRGTRIADELAGPINDFPNDVARRAAIAASAKPDVLIIDFVDNTYRHDLIHPADVLGGRYSQEVAERATRSAGNGGPVDVIETIVRSNAELIQAAQDRRNVRATISKGDDPFVYYSLARRERRGWDSDNPMTDDQRAKIERWRIKKSEQLTEAEADDIIAEVQRRARNGLCTLNQDRVLRRYGYQTEQMPYDEAHGLMDRLAANGWKRI